MTVSAKSPSAVRSGSCTHPGRSRAVNEDRLFADSSSGVFLVVDGMGGHAAGEIAAETARSAILDSLEQRTADLQSDIRRAIAQANNRIFDLAETNAEWRGMACVLTLVLVDSESISWGHVGDSRLYIFREGKLCKLTSDHSPVGIEEDRGLLDEFAAMRHPARHQVSRDVGSKRRNPNESDFVETSTIPWSPADAFLLCSDGLSDALRSSEIAGLIRQYGADPQIAAEQLVSAANAGGGSDNITAIFFAGPEFPKPTSFSGQSRHAITRVRLARRPPLFRRRSTWYLLAGLLLALLLAIAWQNRTAAILKLSTELREWIR